MIGRGLFVLAFLSNCVLSLPVTSSQLENEDVKVMKCIVEALTEVLSRPHPMTVSQECLVTLKTDDRLVSVLRHFNFLKELQEIAAQGDHERAKLSRDTDTPDHVTQTPADDVADRSMLEALGGPGERSILSQKRRTENGDGDEEESLEDGEPLQDREVKRENEDNPGSHVSESLENWNEDKAEKRQEEEEEYEEKSSKEISEEENKDKKGAGSEEKRDASQKKSKGKRFHDDDDKEEEEKKSAVVSHSQEEEQEEEEEKRGSRESLPRWTKRAKLLPLKKKAAGKEGDHEGRRHLKENPEEEEVKKKRNAQRSPEEKELQMIAQRSPEERRALEEEGSASRKSEDPEIESLAAIESELENVAQKLHELRRG
ncbi:uncharacterized protein ACBR49_015458 [Aulostomus maculatus]